MSGNVINNLRADSRLLGQRVSGKEVIFGEQSEHASHKTRFSLLTGSLCSPKSPLSCSRAAPEAESLLAGYVINTLVIVNRIFFRVFTYGRLTEQRKGLSRNF